VSTGAVYQAVWQAALNIGRVNRAEQQGHCQGRTPRIGDLDGTGWVCQLAKSGGACFKHSADQPSQPEFSSHKQHSALTTSAAALTMMASASGRPGTVRAVVQQSGQNVQRQYVGIRNISTNTEVGTSVHSGQHCSCMLPLMRHNNRNS
jgi:hypothetical protein